MTFFTGPMARIRKDDALLIQWNYSDFAEEIKEDYLAFNEPEGSDYIFLTPNVGIGLTRKMYSDYETEWFFPNIQDEVDEFIAFYQTELDKISVPYVIVWGGFTFFS